MKLTNALLFLFLSFTIPIQAGMMDYVWPHSDSTASAVTYTKFQFSDIYNKPFWQNSWFVPVVVTVVVAGSAVVTVMTGGMGAPAGTTATVSVLGMTVATVKTSAIAAAVYGGGAGSYMGGLAMIGGWFGGNAMLGAMILNGVVAATGVVATSATAYGTAALAQSFGMAPDLAEMIAINSSLANKDFNRLTAMLEKNTATVLTGTQMLADRITMPTALPPESNINNNIAQEILTIGPQPQRRAAQIHAKFVQLKLKLSDANGKLLKTANSNTRQIYDVPIIMADVYGTTELETAIDEFHNMNTKFQQGDINQIILQTRATLLFRQIKHKLTSLAQHPWDKLSADEQKDFVGCLLLIGQFQDNDTLIKYASHINPGQGDDNGFLWYLKALALYKHGQALAITGDKTGAVYAFNQAMRLLDNAIESEPKVLESLMLKAIVIDTLASEDPHLYTQIQSLANKVEQHSKNHYSTPNTPAAAYELFGDIYRNAGLHNYALKQYNMAWKQIGILDDNMEKAVISIKISRTHGYLGNIGKQIDFLAKGRNFVNTWSSYVGVADEAQQAQNAQQVDVLYTALANGTSTKKLE